MVFLGIKHARRKRGKRQTTHQPREKDLNPEESL